MAMWSLQKGNNSIQCIACKKWIHKKCSRIKGKLKGEAGYKCPVCMGQAQPSGETTVIVEIRLGQDRLECVDKFCYLREMIVSGSGAEEAARTRVRCAWRKFHELAPIITSRSASLKLKGKVYSLCVQSILVYGSKTRSMMVVDMARL